MGSTSPTIAVLGIGTAVPVNRIDQAEAAQRIAEALKDYPDSMRWAKRIFKQCGVSTRYTCEPELLESAEVCRYLPATPTEQVPSTSDRMKMYKRESVPLALEAARKAMADGNVVPSDITHLITVSCTGQFLPGLDTALIQELGLSSQVLRIPLNFIGCAAGLKAISMSRHLAEAEASAHILIVCVELCTLHIQPSSKREDLFAASFFGDGASACVVGCTGQNRPGWFQLGEDKSVLLPDCAEEMVWEVGNHGFTLYLSPNIPKLIGQFIPKHIQRWYEAENEDLPELWAIHPGGKGIIDVLQDTFGLSDEQTTPSRTVLRQYGNISSATILFVLDQMRRDLLNSDRGPSNGIVLAFGPGLTAEMLQIRYLPRAAVQERKLDDAYV